jgi:N-acetylmuramoyl-L-alanine amidase
VRPNREEYLRARARRRAQVRRRRSVVAVAVATVVVVAVVVVNDLGGSSPRVASDAGSTAAATHGTAVRTTTVDSSAAKPGQVHVAGGGVEIDPSYFTAGACVSFPPTSGNRHRSVFLDAGHGGIDPGGTGVTQSGKALSESTLTLPVELDAATLLRAHGFTVVVSRTKNTTVLRLQSDDVVAGQGELSLLGAHNDEAARDVCADKANVNALVGIYFDSSSSPDNAGSVTGYDPDRPFAKSNLRLATLVQNDVLGAMNAQGWQIPNGGVQSDAGLGSLAGNQSTGSSLAVEALNYNHLMLLGPAESGYFSTPSEMPGALIEPLYLSDPFEGSIADSPSGQRVIADGLAKAVEAYFTPPRAAGSVSR